MVKGTKVKYKRGDLKRQEVPKQSKQKNKYIILPPNSIRKKHPKKERI